MKWFNDLKIKSKLLLGFGVVMLLALIVGYVGYDNGETLADNSYNIGEVRMPGVEALYQIQASQIAVVTGERGLVNRRMTGELRSAQYDWVNKYITKANDGVTKYEALPKNEEEKVLWAQFKPMWSEWINKHNSFIALEKEKDRLLNSGTDSGNERMAEVEANSFNASLDARTALLQCQTKLEEMVALNIAEGKKLVAEGEEQQASSRNTMIFVLLLVIAISLLVGNYIARNVSNMLNKAVNVMKEMAMGHLGVRAKIEQQDEIGELGKTMDIFAEALQVHFLGSLKKIAVGDLNVRLPLQDKDDEIAPAVNSTVDALKGLVDEANGLINAAVNGKLHVRGDENKFLGGYREIVKGVNELLNAVIMPVNEATKILEKMAGGDFTKKMEGDYKGDHEIIKNSINALVDSLNDVLHEIMEAVQATASASNQISASAEEMAAGAQEQSAQATEVASAVEEMASTIVETTKNANVAADSAQEAGHTAKGGGNVVKDTVAGMNRIANVVEKAAETVQALGVSSNEIGEIVQVINDIADQTNLLALNAAIEAARAGEQGRGFAVVADEVRKLAERTTKATKEIADMIKQIQKDTNDAVDSMQEGKKEVESGKVLANKAGQSMDEIVGAASKVLDVVNSVASASEQQASAAEQISKNIEAISNVTQESAAGVQQIARASEDLSRLTENLQMLVNKFNILNKTNFANSNKKTLRNFDNKLLN